MEFLRRQKEHSAFGEGLEARHSISDFLSESIDDVHCRLNLLEAFWYLC